MGQEQLHGKFETSKQYFMAERDYLKNICYNESANQTDKMV